MRFRIQCFKCGSVDLKLIYNDYGDDVNPPYECYKCNMCSKKFSVQYINDE